MSEWWTYRLSNFLMFSPQVYDRLFELQNRAWWPAPLLALVLGAGMLVLMRRRSTGAGRAVALLLALAWLFVAWTFFAQRYARIHLGGNVFAVAFALQALLLCWIGAVRARLAFEHGTLANLGAALFAAALAGWPLLAPWMGRSWWQAEVFGLAPDPTALATLGMLLACRRVPWLLVPLPLLWLLFSGATLWTMDRPWSLLAPAAALLALVLVAAKPRLRV
jgi:hypothetical protein